MSEGLAIICDTHSIMLNNIHANKNFIQETFNIIGTNIHGHLTNVYFPQEAMHRIEILNSLSTINTDRKHPLWMTRGDFSMITRMEEKTGGMNREDKEGIHLKEFIQNNWLINMPFNNVFFTWSNKRVGLHEIASRPNRFLLSNNAIHLGGYLTTSILPLSGSDHWPISIQWTRPGSLIRRPFNSKIFGCLIQISIT